jgi:Carboxypeptidase regulatory-like domain
MDPARSTTGTKVGGMGGTTRRKLIAALAAALLAAGCSARSFDRVCGTVLDARTRQPVAQAKVTAMAPGTAQITATTDARGRFTFRHLSRRARLRVTAGNYRPAEVQPTGELLGVALAPTPVRGMVRSTLTGGGLRATVAGPNLTPTAADGSFQVYGLGPGDRLTVTAPGYKTAVATIGANRRVRVALAPEEATRIRQVNGWLRAGDFVSLWRWVFRTPKGYGYVDLPADFKAEVRQQYTTAIGSTGRSVRGFEGTWLDVLRWSRPDGEERLMRHADRFDAVRRMHQLFEDATQVGRGEIVAAAR